MTFFVAALWLSTTVELWPPAWLTLVQFSPFVIGAIGVFVSIWLNRIQPLLLIVSIILVNFVLAYYAPMEQESIAKTVLFPIVSFLLPFNIFLWALLPEKGVQNRGINFFVISLIALQACFVYWFMNEMPLDWVVELSKPVVPGLDYYTLPFMSSFMFLVAGFSVSLKLQKQVQLKIFDHSVLFILLLMGFALNQYLHAGVLQWVSTVAMLMVQLALLFDSHHIAYTDELTGLKSRRALNEAFMSLGKKYSIAMVDIDFFKQFNDTYGHDLGDIVLKMVASTLDGVRKGGKAYRFGGEEFTLLFKNRRVEEIKDELERLRQEVEAEVIEVIEAGASGKGKKQPQAKLVNVTVSMGVAEPSKQHPTPQEVVKYADEGLYKAKKTGRNRVIVQTTPPAKQAAKKTESKN